jgi:ribosomal protein S18 acetylase RimI-like enzyme
MKRMFVAEEYRELGVGRALLERVVAQAGSIGYRAMRLDTSRHQLEAISLYASAGFRRIPPYYAVPKGMEDWLVFYEKSL